NQEEPVEFYSEDEMIDIIAEYLFQADDEGFFKLDEVNVGLFRVEGDIYGTVDAWAEKIHTSSKTDVAVIKKVLTEKLVGTKYAAIPGITYSGEIQKNAFYSQRDVFTACTEFKNPFDREDKELYKSRETLTPHQKRVFGHFLGSDSELANEREITSAMDQLHLLLQKKDELAHRVNIGSIKHPALAEDTVYVIPPQYKDIYRLLEKNTGIRIYEEEVFAFLENRGLVKLVASELSPLSEDKDEEWND
ncbi:hypothetical protein ACFL3C_03170, partial [Patescibacteria group bacterium]